MPADLPICRTCGVQYGAPRENCPICDDQRQYVGWDGQQWTTLAELRDEGHRGLIQEEGPGVVGVGAQPPTAIGQRALLVRSPAGNVLGDMISYIDDDLVAAVRERAGSARSRSVIRTSTGRSGMLVGMDRKLLAPVRLSRFTDASRNPESQRARIGEYAADNGDTVIWTEVDDLGVSGAKPIRERPGLGPWLAPDRIASWDAIIADEADRLSRDMLDYLQFARDMAKLGKVIIDISDGTDTSTERGRQQRRRPHSCRTAGTRAYWDAARKGRTAKTRGGELERRPASIWLFPPL